MGEEGQSPFNMRGKSSPSHEAAFGFPYIETDYILSTRIHWWIKLSFYCDKYLKIIDIDSLSHFIKNRSGCLKSVRTKQGKNTTTHVQLTVRVNFFLFDDLSCSTLSQKTGVVAALEGRGSVLTWRFAEASAGSSHTSCCNRDSTADCTVHDFTSPSRVRWSHGLRVQIVRPSVMGANEWNVITEVSFGFFAVWVHFHSQVFSVVAHGAAFYIVLWTFLDEQEILQQAPSIYRKAINWFFEQYKK